MKFERSILFLDHSHFVGGAERSLIPLVHNIGNANMVCTFEDGDFTTLLRKEKIEYSIIPSGNRLRNVSRNSGVVKMLVAAWYSLAAIFWLVAQLRHYEILYINTFKSMFVGLPAAILARKRVVIHVRDIITKTSHQKIAVIAFRVLISMTRHQIIANSLATKDALIQIGIRESSIEVVYNGIAVPSLQPQFKPSKDGILKLGVFSRITPWKGQKLALQLMNELPIDRFALYIVGGYDSSDKEYYHDLLRFQSTHQLNNVIFQGHLLDPLTLMNEMDIILLPSIEPEPFGRVIIEAMMLQKTVIATGMGGVTEIVKHSETGFLAQPNVESFLNIIQILEQNKNIITDVGKNGQIFAIRHFCDGRMVEKVNKILMNFCDSQANRSTDD